MPRVLVIHRKPALAAEYARRLSTEGFEASAYPVLGASAFRTIRAAPPDVILIDLTELPSYGRAMGVMLREQKGTRQIPLVFLKGDPEKAARVREVLPDVAFATWPRLAAALRQAMARAPKTPAPPNLAAIPLARKMRIGEATVIALLQAPPNIREILGSLPEGVRFEKPFRQAGLVLLFVKSAAALARALPAIAPRMERGRTLWVCWPKRTSGEPCDLTLVRIREMASPHHLVDSKICAVDRTWSGAALTLKRARKGAALGTAHQA